MEGEAGEKPVYDMIFGKLRGLIRDDGPRSGMEVRDKIDDDGAERTSLLQPEEHQAVQRFPFYVDRLRRGRSSGEAGESRFWF